MFSVYFIMQMSNGCCLTWSKWVNSIFLFTLIIQTATKKKRSALKTNLGNLFLSLTLPSSRTTANRCWNWSFVEWGAWAGCCCLGWCSALAAAAAHGPLPRMILIPWSSMGTVCWQTEQIWIGKIHSWHWDTQLRWMQRRAARWRCAGSQALLA